MTRNRPSPSRRREDIRAWWAEHFLFRGKRSYRVKAIVWGRTGLAIWYMRLERGKYKWPTPDAASMELTEQELALLLDGADFTRIRRLPPFTFHRPLQESRE